MGDEVKRVAVLGSTGSIGRQTLDVIRAFPHRFRVTALTAGYNLDLLAQQIKEFKPDFVHHQGNPFGSTQGKGKLSEQAGADYEILPPEAIVCLPSVDTVVIATSGKAGLVPTMAAIRAGKVIALANKEALVMAGEIVTTEATRHGTRILPIDSEHSAIWQCLNGEPLPSSIILTASGGPFRGYSPSQLEKVTLEQSLKHPSWQMGKKVTIDSATLMNKGLEVIEAHWLFGVPFENIRVVVHPQSIIHSMVEFADGSIKAQLSCPDMRLPIQYALSYPDRLPNPELKKLDWEKIASLDFEAPDMDAFPCLKLAIEAGKAGGTCPAVLCAADEEAVELFLSKKIKFTDIPLMVEKTLHKHSSEPSLFTPHPNLEEIFAADTWSRQQVRRLYGKE